MRLGLATLLLVAGGEAAATTFIPSGGGYVATRGALTRRVVQLGPDLGVTVLAGYPQVEGFPGDHTTVGFLFSNAGEQRDVRIEVRDVCTAVRHVVVPAEEERAVFLYLPPTLADSVSAVLRSGPHRADITIDVTHARESFTRAFGVLGGYEAGAPSGWLPLGVIDAYLPDDWRGLSGFAAIGTRHADLLAHEKWRPVLSEWIAMGGVLLVETPAWMRHDKMFGELPLERRENVEVRDDVAFVVHSGLGAIAYLHPRTARVIRDHPLYSLGLTTPHVTAHDNRASAVSEFVSRTLTDVITPPYAGLLTILTLFVLLVGPAGWIYWMRFRRRPFVYLTWTIAGSTLFCGAVIVADILSEGRIPVGSARSVRLVDHRANVELEFEEAAVWPPLRMNNDLAAPVDASLFVARDHVDADQPDCSIDVAQRTQVHTNVLPVRSGRLVGMRRVARPRGRLAITPAGHALQAENHLEEDLESLFVWHDDTLYRFDALERGERATGRKMIDASHLPEVPGGFVTGPAAMVMAEIVSGGRGERRFVAKVSRAGTASRLLASGLRELDAPAHYVAGLY